MTGKLRIAMMATAWLLAAPALQAAEVTGIDVETDDSEVRLVLQFDGTPPEPRVFSTQRPPRLVVDMPDTDSGIGGERVPIAAGPARGYTALGSGGRTRLVIDLSRQVSHEMRRRGSELVLAIADTGPARSATSRAGRFALTDIDFRRGEDDAGRVLVNLDRSGVNMSVNDRQGQLVVDLFDTRLPEQLSERLDVTDFATPVTRISPQQRGDNARLLLDVEGAYEHVAWQTGNQVVVEIAPPAEPEPEGREVTFFEEREYEGDRITLNFQDIEVRSVLQLIADVSDRNIVVSDSVSGSVTLRLNNVPWDQALDIVLETKNLDMRESGNVIWIAPTEEIAQREQQILQARADREGLEPLRSVMISVSYASAGELAELIQAASENETGLLSERGSVSVDTRTNTLLVNDTPERVAEIRQLVEELDRPVRQVLIESRIVIANHDFNHELGVRFGVTGMYEDSDGNVISTSGTGLATDQINRSVINNRSTGDPADVPFIDDRLNVNLPAANPTGSLGFSILAADYLLDLELSAMETDGRGEIVSTPRVITANQAEAYIHQGVEIPYESAQGGAQAGAVNVEFKEAVLELRATPLITPDNRIQLQLAVKQDTIGEIFETGRGGSVPSIDTREMETRVLLENGQTVVLGGIFQEERQTTNSKVPMLGDVPVLGILFRRNSTEERKRELLIFVTPSILDDRAVLD